MCKYLTNNSVLKKLMVIKSVLLVLFLQGFVECFNPVYGQNENPNTTCEENLEKANDAYYDSEYDEAIGLVGLCLNQKEISKDQKMLAFTILARTLIAMENLDQAKKYIGKILDLNPDYTPTIEEETPKYVSIVVLVKNEKNLNENIENETGLSSWWWIGAGGVVATAAIIVIASSGENKKKNIGEPLSEPPPFP